MMMMMMIMMMMMMMMVVVVSNVYFNVNFILVQFPVKPVREYVSVNYQSDYF